MPSTPSGSATKSEQTGGRPSALAVLGVNHLGLAPKDPAKARWFFHEALGLPLLGEELVLEQETLTVMFSSSATSPARGEARLELLVPPAPGQGPIAAFLAKRGSGIHHVALAVANLEALLAHLTQLGVRLIDEAPRAGAHQTRIAFVHPEATGGLLVELVQDQSER